MLLLQSESSFVVIYLLFFLFESVLLGVAIGGQGSTKFLMFRWNKHCFKGTWI